VQNATTKIHDAVSAFPTKRYAPASMRPWRYWGVQLRSDEERRWLSLSITITLSALSLWTAYAVIRAIVRVASGTKYGPAFWPALVILTLFDAWVTWRAILRWRKIMAQHS
jgi:hypothetical protein